MAFAISHLLPACGSHLLLGRGLLPLRHDPAKRHRPREVGGSASSCVFDVGSTFLETLGGLGHR